MILCHLGIAEYGPDVDRISPSISFVVFWILFPPWFSINNHILLGRISSTSVFVLQDFLLRHCCHEHRPPSHSVWIILSVNLSSWRRIPMLFHVGVQQRIKCWIQFLLHQPSFNLHLPKHEVSTFWQRALVTKVCLVPHCYSFCKFLLVCPVLEIICLKTEYYAHCSTEAFRSGHTYSRHTPWSGFLHCIVAAAENDMKILGTASFSSDDKHLSFEALCYFGHFWNSTHLTATMPSIERKALHLWLAS